VTTLTLLLSLAAAGPPADPVRDAVAATAEAARKRDWPAYAKSLDPADVKAFRADWGPLLEGLAKSEPDRQAGFLAMFPRAKTLDAVLKYTPEEFLAEVMAGTDRGQLFRGPVTETTTILGVVPEGADAAHAVVRATRKWAGAEVSAVEVVSARKIDGAWKTALSPVLKQLGVAMRATVTAGAAAQAATAEAAAAEEKPRPVEERPKPARPDK
jgi:hypothetical protein